MRQWHRCSTPPDMLSSRPSDRPAVDTSQPATRSLLRRVRSTPSEYPVGAKVQDAVRQLRNTERHATPDVKTMYCVTRGVRCPGERTEKE